MSCSMIITDANELAAKVHDRMPVLLQSQDFDGWLTGTAGTELLRPAASACDPKRTSNLK
jgi:putative SOS response-associated peptidase YedK